MQLSASIAHGPTPTLIAAQQVAGFSWILHPLRAGFPSPAGGYEEEALDFNEYLIGHHQTSTFVFSVAGDSMRDAGIVDGDKVVVDRALAPKHRDIVVAIVDDGFTLKRLLLKAGQPPELHAENPAFAPRTFAEGETLDVWGVVVGVVRRYSAAR